MPGQTLCRASRADDELVLLMLDMADRQGVPYKDIAARTRTSRNTVASALKRVRDEHRHGCDCTKPENMDGGMPPLWWRQ